MENPISTFISLVDYSTSWFLMGENGYKFDLSMNEHGLIIKTHSKPTFNKFEFKESSEKPFKKVRSMKIENDNIIFETKETKA